MSVYILAFAIQLPSLHKIRRPTKQTQSLVSSLNLESRGFCLFVFFYTKQMSPITHSSTLGLSASYATWNGSSDWRGYSARDKLFPRASLENTASNREDSSSNGALLGTIKRCIRCKIPETATNVQGCSSETIIIFFSFRGAIFGRMHGVSEWIAILIAHVPGCGSRELDKFSRGHWSKRVINKASKLILMDCCCF